MKIRRRERKRGGREEKRNKAKAHNTYIVPQAACCSCSGAFMSQTERAYSF